MGLNPKDLNCSYRHKRALCLKEHQLQLFTWKIIESLRLEKTFKIIESNHKGPVGLIFLAFLPCKNDVWADLVSKGSLRTSEKSTQIQQIPHRLYGSSCSSLLVDGDQRHLKWHETPVYRQLNHTHGASPEFSEAWSYLFSRSLSLPSPAASSQPFPYWGGPRVSYVGAESNRTLWQTFLSLNLLW